MTVYSVVGGKQQGCEHPIIINAGRSEGSLSSYLITLFLATNYPMQKFVLTGSLESLSSHDNDILFLDSEGIANLGKLIDWQLLKGKVSYRNLKGYSVSVLMGNKRESSLIAERKALIKVSDLKKAIVDYLVQTTQNVEMRLECLDEQVEIKNVQDQRLPSLKYVNKEGKHEEVISQMIVDCERKSFVMRSVLNSFNSSLTVSQSPSTYAYMRLNIPFDVLNPLMSDDEIHIYQSEEVTLVAVPTFDLNLFSTIVLFNDTGIASPTSILSKFFSTEFPATYPLVSEYISNQFSNQRAEIVYNYKIGSSSVGNILFIDDSELPIFGDHKLHNCFEFIDLLRNDISKYGVARPDSQIFNSTISFDQNEEDVKYIQTKITKFRQEKENFIKSKRSIMKLCWEVVKSPFAAVGNHLLEVFGFRPTDIPTGQKWMFRIAYVIAAVVLKYKIESYLEVREFTNSMIQKVGGSSKLFADLVREGCASGWDIRTLQKIIWKSRETLSITQIEAISGMLRYSFDKKDFLEYILASGNIQKLDAFDVDKIFKLTDSISCNSKLKLIEKLKSFIYLKSNSDIKIIVGDIILTADKEQATKILQECVRK